MSTPAGVDKVKAMAGQGWVYAGGVGQGDTPFTRHEDYHEAFLRDWNGRHIPWNVKSGAPPDVPEVPGVVGKRTEPYNKEVNGVKKTTCVCGQEIQNIIHMYHPQMKEWEWIGCECVKHIEAKHEHKLCGGCKKNYHKNFTRLEDGKYENRCKDCQAKKKKKKKIRQCEVCLKDISKLEKWKKQCYQCYSRGQYESLND